MFQRMQKQFQMAGLWLFLAIIPATAVLGQSTMGEPRDIDFQVINATTGEPGRLDRLQIQYLSVRLEPVIDVRPDGSEFQIRDVPLKERGKYLVTAWYQGVPYFWSLKGRKLMDETTLLHIFDTTSDMTDVTVPGLTILFRKGSSLVELEYMINLDNAMRPQKTVSSPGHTFELTLPTDAANIAATYNRGPEPLPVAVTKLGGGRIGLQVPLTSGSNQVRVTASIPWRDGLEFPVGSSLEIVKWGFMVSPENLGVVAMEFEQDYDTQVPGYLRFTGPRLDPGRIFQIRIDKGLPAEPAEDVFTQDVPAAEDETTAAETGEDEDDGVPLPIKILPVIIVIIILARRRWWSK